MKSTMSSVVATFVLHLSLLVPTALPLRIVYVTPSELQKCSGNPCHTLAFYQQFPNKYFISDTTMIFMSGTHKMETGNVTIIQNTSGLSLIGSSNFTKASYNIQGLLEPSSRIQYIGHNSGFLFQSVSSIIIQNLAFQHCGHELSYRIFAAISFNTANNITLSRVIVCGSIGFGLYANQLSETFLLTTSAFLYNAGSSITYGGNALFWYRDCPTNSKAQLEIKSSWFMHGNDSHKVIYNLTATGITITIECPSITVNIDDTLLLGNQEYNGGAGNIAINFTDFGDSHINITNSIIASGLGNWGGGMALSLMQASGKRLCSGKASCDSSHSDNRIIVTISNTQFIGNHAGASGGAVYLLYFDERNLHTITYTREIMFDNCTFNGNTIPSHVGVGAAVRIIRHQIPEGLTRVTPQVEVTFKASLFSNNSFYQFNDKPIQSSVIGTYSVERVTFEDCNFTHNRMTALAPLSSYLVLKGDILFQGNMAISGGALKILDSSIVLIRNNTHVKFVENYVFENGGAIFAPQLYNAPCFFQLSVPDYTDVSDLKWISLKFVNNTAEEAGSGLYGGLVDYCLTYQHILTNDTTTNFHGHSSFVFNKIFDISEQPGDSAVSSAPFGVCLCNGSDYPDCSIKTSSVNIFPGELFHISVVVVGQRDGVVPGVVEAVLIVPSNSSELPSQYEWQQTGKQCIQLNYTVLSTCSQETIRLTTLQLNHEVEAYAAIFNPPSITVSFHSCPWGFTVQHTPPYCDCDPRLRNHKITCDIISQMIHRPVPVWIGYYQTTQENLCNTTDSCDGVIVHTHCPYDYCNPHNVDIDRNSTDKQCAFNHTGILCGACQEGLSLALGNSNCLHCSNLYLLLVFSIILAGVVLVFFLTTCNLTVSEGTINGLIFYANIVQANHAIFFPSELMPHILTEISTIFIAWINLDLGIEVCFYNGMDFYAKTWLQFAFSFYIWVISALIIVLSRRFTAVVRVTGRHSVKVLATLILLSFTRLQRTVIAVLSFTTLNYPDGSTRTVWLSDGNLQYLSGRHIPLFIAANVVFVISLLFTLLLLFLPCLMRFNLPHLKRLKPFFDTYMGPCKVKYRFWPGHVLLVRLILFVSFALNSLGEPKLNLLLTIAACAHLLMLNVWIFRGVYMRWPLDVLESAYFLNIGVLSAATAYVLQNGGNQAAVTHTSVSIAFITFLGTLLYHAIKQVTSSRTWKRFSHWLSQKQNPENPLELAPLEEDNMGETRQQSPTWSEIPPPARFDECREPLLEEEDN